MTWLAVLVGFAFAVFVVLAYRCQWRWTGLTEVRRAAGGHDDVQPAKTLWDWLQLLVIPLALAGVAFALNEVQTQREQRREDDRFREQRATAIDAAREDTLRAYLTQMSGLMLDRRLLRSKPRSDVQAVARTATLTAVRRLDDERRGLAVKFLDEARLLQGRGAKVNLAGADLRRAALRDASLAGDNLRGADLRGANLEHADLRDAELRGADLQDAQLQNADLRNAYLRAAELQGADLQGARLRDADLQSVELRGAGLQGAMLRGADLQGADLRRADLQGADLRRANLQGADLRDGDLELGSPYVRSADLQGTRLRSTSLLGADLRGADLRGAELRGTDLRGAKLQGARLK